MSVVVEFFVTKLRRNKWVSSRYPGKTWGSMEQAVGYTVEQEWYGA